MLVKYYLSDNIKGPFEIFVLNLWNLWASPAQHVPLPSNAGFSPSKEMTGDRHKTPKIQTYPIQLYWVM